MLRRFRPSPALVVSLIALFVSLGGMSYAAATKIGTRGIKNGAVTSKKLHKNAVTAKKIRKGAVTGSKLANRSIGYTKVDGSLMSIYTAGAPMAGINVAANGTVRRFFNHFGGAPTVSHPQAGVYQIAFPGLGGLVTSRSSISQATLISGLGEIRVSSAGKNPIVRTANSTGNPANRAFNFTVIYRSP
jgi:hypothetical protein